MIWPPSILRLRIAEQGKRGINLWLPVFLLWPLLILVILVAPVIALCIPDLRKNLRGFSKLTIGLDLCEAFAAMRGLSVNVNDKDNRVIVAFW